MKNRFLSAFILKIVALVAMTLDHLGALLPLYTNLPNALYLAFRIIGRLALPLFLFLLFEGINHSKNKEKYLLRIGILASVILVGELIINILYWNGLSTLEIATPNNIIDLLLCALFLYFSYHSKKGVRFLAILPFAYALLSTVVACIEAPGEIVITWLPYFVRADYGFFGMMFVTLMYFFERFVTRRYLKDNKDFTENMLRATPEYESTKTTFCGLALLITGVVFWITFTLFIPNYDPFSFGVGIQSYSILAGILIMFYSGKLGYHAKWFQYGCYLYFPLHLILIFVILQLAFKGTLL